MKIRSSDLVAGMPAKQIRELLRQSDEFLSASHAIKIFGLKDEAAKRLIAGLSRDGYIERNFDVPDKHENWYWKRTVKGNALCKALFSRPVSRKMAEKALKEFLQRIHAVNKNPYYLYKVQRASVFGSFLTEATYVGDVDIAIDLVRKEPDPQKHFEMTMARAREASGHGKHIGSFVDRIGFAEREAKLFLKARSRIIQLTDYEDGVLAVAASRTIYGGSGIADE